MFNLSTTNVAGDLVPARVDPGPARAAALDGIDDLVDPEAALVLVTGGEEEGLLSLTVIRAGMGSGGVR